MPAGTWLGGVQLANPDYEMDGITQTWTDVGALHEMLDGSLCYDFVGDRQRWHLRWNNVSYTEKNNINARYVIKTEQVFSPPYNDSLEVTVIVIPNSWRMQYIEQGDGTKLWSCEMELEATSV